MEPHPYTVSIQYDRRLYKQDIAGSTAHARMLARQGIISEEDALSIIQGLTAIEEEIRSGTFPWKEELEDLHMNIEARLFEVIGDAAGRLHTARSRNDQVAVDTRLYAKEVTQETLQSIRKLQSALLDVAEAHQEVILPGYTHLQRAQPVLLSPARGSWSSKAFMIGFVMNSSAAQRKSFVAIRWKKVRSTALSPRKRI